jgi:hypothetical protein
LLPIPFEWFTIRSQLTAAEIVARLSSHLEGDGLIIGRPKYKILRTPTFFEAALNHFTDDIAGDPEWFRGRVWPTGFKVWRITGIRNAFLPIIRGRLVPARGNGTDIKISMRLHPLVAAFVAFIVSVGVVTGVSSLDPTRRSTAFVSCVFAIALVLGGFWFEAPKSKHILLKLFEGHGTVKGER